MRADVRELPIEQPARQEAASLSAALLTAVGVGLYELIPTAAEAAYRSERTVFPRDKDCDTYAIAY